MSGALFDLVIVHCIACDHTVSDLTPQAAHAAMEDHYCQDHGWCGHQGGHETAAIICSRGRSGWCARLMRCRECGATVTADDLAAFTKGAR